MPEDKKIGLKVIGIANAQVQAGAYAIILEEEDGRRRLPIAVGVAEAQSIALALEHVKTPRPMTHDVINNVFNILNIQLQEVFIYRYDEGVFYSEMTIKPKEGMPMAVDMRPSDAIALALRTGSPIYVADSVLLQYGVLLEEIEEADEDSSEADEDGDERELLAYIDPEEVRDADEMVRWLAMQTDGDLTAHLENAVKKENYEHAKVFRDELERRNHTNDNKQ
jgi:bifunctional DNase/RNase